MTGCENVTWKLCGNYLCLVSRTLHEVNIKVSQSLYSLFRIKMCLSLTFSIALCYKIHQNLPRPPPPHTHLKHTYTQFKLFVIHHSFIITHRLPSFCMNNCTYVYFNRETTLSRNISHPLVFHLLGLILITNDLIHKSAYSQD